MGFFRLRHFTAMVCIALLVLSACKKKEIQGPKGEPGEPGIGGNATITSVVVFTVESSSWQVDSAANCRRAFASLPQLTKNVVDRGTVRVSMQADPVFSHSAWTELPYVSGDLFTQFGFGEGFLYLDFINIEGGIPAAPPTRSYKVVIVSEI